MYIIREDKKEKLSEHIGKALRYLGEAMTCIDELEREEGSDMGERYGNRYVGRYGNRGGYRDLPDNDDMGERRGGRYGRYY